MIGSELHRQEQLYDRSKYMGKIAVLRNLEETTSREFGKLLNRASSLMEKMRVDLRNVKLTWSIGHSMIRATYKNL